MFQENEIDGSLLMYDGLDDGMIKELIPKLKDRILFNSERKKLKEVTRSQQTKDNDVTNPQEKPVATTESTLHVVNPGSLDAIQPAATAGMQITSSFTGHLHKAFVKFQNTREGFSFDPTNDFVYAPQLNETFHITKNTLFKVTFQGALYNLRQHRLDQYVQIIVNDYLIIYNRLVPNTNQRVAMLDGINTRQTDSIGGYYYDCTNADTMVPITRIAMVFLSPGTYTFNVGVRSLFGSGKLRGGTIIYELTQFENSNNTEDLGDFKLATFPT